MFQAMGNTLPSLVTSAVRIAVSIVPVLILSRQPGFELKTIWYISVVSVILQMVLNLALLRREFRLRLAR
jgi:Na+-driven multidrug efflux pump